MGNPLCSSGNRRVAQRKKVLISPYAILKTDWNARHIDVALTKKQVENSPSIDTHLPVSRQHEVAYLGYYGYPYYWGGPYLWGPGYYPSGLAVPLIAAQQNKTDTNPGASTIPTSAARRR